MQLLTDKGEAAAAEAKEPVGPGADASPSIAPAGAMTAQASMAGGQRSWWSFFGLF